MSTEPTYRYSVSYVTESGARIALGEKTARSKYEACELMHAEQRSKYPKRVNYVARMLQQRRAYHRHKLARI